MRKITSWRKLYGKDTLFVWLDKKVERKTIYNGYAYIISKSGLSGNITLYKHGAYKIGARLPHISNGWAIGEFATVKDAKNIAMCLAKKMI